MCVCVNEWEYVYACVQKNGKNRDCLKKTECEYKDREGEVLQLNEKNLNAAWREKKRLGADLLSQQIFKKNLTIVYSDMN